MKGASGLDSKELQEMAGEMEAMGASEKGVDG
jgi:hypothetical protein